MKKIILIHILLFTTLLFSQNFNEKLDRVKALRIEYLSNELDLTQNEAEKFWPIFNDYDKKQFELHREKRKLMMKLNPKNSVNLSEEELTKLIQEDEKIESDIVLNKKQLTRNLQGIIPTKKIVLLRKLEVDFKQKLLNKIKNKKNNN